MKLILLSILLFTTSIKPKIGLNAQTNYVYICVSPNAVAYHKSSNSCRGIQNCSHEIKQVTVDEAINTYHLRACKICY